MSTAKAGQGRTSRGSSTSSPSRPPRGQDADLATWQAAKASFGNGASTVRSRSAATNHDGILNAAPGKDGDGDVDQSDLQAIGATSIRSVAFTIG